MPEQPQPLTDPPTPVTLFKVAGIDYSIGGIEKLRQELGGMRAELLGTNDNPDFYKATLLSHTIALLSYLQDWLRETEAAQQNRDV